MYSVTQHGNACLIRVEHDLDIVTSPTLASAIDLAAAGTSGRIIVSLEACAYCDASTLTVLLRAKASLGDRLAIFVPRGNHVRRIFEITGLTTRLGVMERLPPTGDTLPGGSMAAGA